MKPLNSRFTFVLLLGLARLSVGAEANNRPGIAGRFLEVPALAYGFQAMERPELLPFFLPNGTQTKQFITYDPAGQNQSGFFKCYEENGEYVFFDEIGPGCLYRQQMNVFASNWTKFPNEEIRIRYYFDDEAQPRIDMTFAEFFGKGGKHPPPFTPPLAYFDLKGTQWSKGPGAFAVLYYPLAFEKRLKVTAYHPAGMRHYEATWFQYTYLKYPPGVCVVTWKGREVDSPVVRAQWERVGEDPKGHLAGKTLRTTNAIPAGGKAMILDLRGAGAIGALKLHLEPWTRETFFRTRIRITWDNQPVPAVDMSLGSFFGAGGDTIGAEDVSGHTLSTLLFGFDAKAKQFHSYWPMPYWSRAQVEIVNESPTAITQLVAETTSLSPEVIRYPAGVCGHFRAKRTMDISPDQVPYSRAFRERGRGKVVGLTMFSAGYNMDGDEFTFIDDSLTPQIHGDGTEDDHNQGWGGYAIQKPLWGGLVNGFQGGYRLYTGEPYIFDSSIRINYEHSNLGPDHGQKTDFVVWYYLAEPGVANLKLTDELEIGQDASEQAHQQTVVGVKWSGTTASCYDRYEQQARVPTTTDTGRAFTGSSEFVAKLDPANEGVKLRRRVNRHLANVQRANVRVDGQLIPEAPWYVCDLPVPDGTAFRDTDYEIPARYTKGKARITVRIEHVRGLPDDSSNEYRYWVYCYGRTPLPVQPLLTPGPVSATHTSDSTMELRWLDEMDGVGRVRIQRRAEGESAFTTIGTVAAGTAVFQDTTFRPLTQCAYRLQAFNDAGESEPSPELVVLTPGGLGLPNLARGAKASASSVWKGQEHTPDKAIDGNQHTRWNSASGRMQNEWLEVDLGREASVVAVELFQETQWTRINAYVLQAMVEGQWEDVHVGQEMPDAVVCRFDPVVTRRVRLLVKSTTGNTPTIREMCVFGKASHE